MNSELLLSARLNMMYKVYIYFCGLLTLWKAE